MKKHIKETLTSQLYDYVESEINEMYKIYPYGDTTLDDIKRLLRRFYPSEDMIDDLIDALDKGDYYNEDNHHIKDYLITFYHEFIAERENEIDKRVDNTAKLRGLINELNLSCGDTILVNGKVYEHTWLDGDFTSSNYKFKDTIYDSVSKFIDYYCTRN